MKHHEFEIGQDFTLAGYRYRCTDIGKRTIVAIKLDGRTIVTVKDGVRDRHYLNAEQVEAAGWYNGPPYAVSERVFDENDIVACTTE